MPCYDRPDAPAQTTSFPIPLSTFSTPMPALLLSPRPPVPSPSTPLYGPPTPPHPPPHYRARARALAHPALPHREAHAHPHMGEPRVRRVDVATDGADCGPSER